MEIHGSMVGHLRTDSTYLVRNQPYKSLRAKMARTTVLSEDTVLDPSFGQDPSVGQFKFLTHFWLNYYQIKYTMSSTTP